MCIILSPLLPSTQLTWGLFWSLLQCVHHKILNSLEGFSCEMQCYIKQWDLSDPSFAIWFIVAQVICQVIFVLTMLSVRFRTSMSTLTIIHVNCEHMFQLSRASFFSSPYLGMQDNHCTRTLSLSSWTFVGLNLNPIVERWKQGVQQSLMNTNICIPNFTCMFCKTSQVVLWDTFPFVSNFNQNLWNFGNLASVLSSHITMNWANWENLNET
jgi:hypothetical protein